DRAGLGQAHLGDPLGLGGGQRDHLLGFPLAQIADLVALRARQRAGLFGLLLGAGEVGAALVLLHLDRKLALGDRRLLLGLGLGLPQLAFLLGGDLLPFIGAHLLVGDLALAQLGQDALDLVVALGVGPRR